MRAAARFNHSMRPSRPMVIDPSGFASAPCWKRVAALRNRRLRLRAWSCSRSSTRSTSPSNPARRRGSAARPCSQRCMRTRSRNCHAHRVAKPRASASTMCPLAQPTMAATTSTAHARLASAESADSNTRLVNLAVSSRLVEAVFPAPEIAPPPHGATAQGPLPAQGSRENR